MEGFLHTFRKFLFNISGYTLRMR